LANVRAQFQVIKKEFHSLSLKMKALEAVLG
jgi:hypothetical protein